LHAVSPWSVLFSSRTCPYRPESPPTDHDTKNGVGCSAAHLSLFCPIWAKTKAPKWATRQPTPFLAPRSVGGDSGRYGHVRELNNTLPRLTACNHDLDADPRSRSNLPVRSRWGDRCEIEDRSAGRDLTQLASEACNSARGHVHITRGLSPFDRGAKNDVGCRIALLGLFCPIWATRPQMGRAATDAILGHMTGWGQAQTVPIFPRAELHAHRSSLARSRPAL